MQERLILFWEISSVEHKDVAARFILGFQKEKDNTFQVQGEKKN